MVERVGHRRLVVEAAGLFPTGVAFAEALTRASGGRRVITTSLAWKWANVIEEQSLDNAYLIHKATGGRVGVARFFPDFEVWFRPRGRARTTRAA